MPAIEKARIGDAQQLAQLAEDTFRTTFATANTDENMALHCRQSYGENIQAAEIADPNRSTLLCKDRGVLMAYAQLRWGSAPGCVSGRAAGEIQRLYVAREWQGKGIAQQLMHACLNEMKARGSDVAWLGVWERNPRAIAFYRKFGFVEVGSHVFPLGNDPQRDILMARLIAPEQE